MKLICPSCGAVHSAEAWSNDAVARQSLIQVGALPHGIGSRVFAYLSLFRSAGRSLQWKKVLRLMVELRELTTLPHIQWEKGVARPNSAHAWSMAMERVIENPPKRLPLKTHGYLRAVAYEIADEMDRAVEVKRNKEERKGNPHRRHSGEHPRPSGESRNPEKAEPERITSEDMKVIRRKNMGKEKFSYEIKDGGS